MGKHAGSLRAWVRPAIAGGVVVALLAALVVTYSLVRQDPIVSTAATPASTTSGAPSAAPSPSTSPVPTASKSTATARENDRVKKQARRAELISQQAARRRLQAPTTFRVASFNVLGSSHTAPGGNRKGWAPGEQRMRWAVQILLGAGIQVAGLQEFEPPQLNTFQQAAPAWEVYPGTSISARSSANSIVWDGTIWELVEAQTIEIPYFFGRPTPMPYVRLRNITTGLEVWFANFHNPADVHGPAARWRAEAVARETNLANKLSSDGTPVVMTGDMNDRAEYFCPMTAQTELRAANGGSTGVPCSPPAVMNVDWIMGSQPVVFTNFESTDAGLVGRTSDHPLVTATATVAGSATARGR